MDNKKKQQEIEELIRLFSNDPVFLVSMFEEIEKPISFEPGYFDEEE